MRCENLRNQLKVLSIPIDAVTMDESVERIYGFMKQPGLHIVATANAEMVMLAREDEELKNILNRASLVVPDGAGVLWAAEQKGEHFPERVTGIDLTRRLFKMAATKNTPIYCLGAADGVAQQAVDNLQREVGPLNIVGIHSGFFNADEEKKIIKTIQDGGAKLIFVALGVPKQEKWIAQRLSQLDGVVAMGVGGSFDVLAGNIPRAPQWMQRHRLEWLYRLYLEPKRITRMVALPKFMFAVKTNKN